MKRYSYTIQININKFYALEYNPEKKSSDPILLPLMYDNEDQGAFLYRNFDKQEEAKAFFEILSYFYTASEIEISVDKDVLNETDTVIGSTKLAIFTLKDEEYPLNSIKKHYESIDWDINVDLYTHTGTTSKVEE